MTLDSLVSKSGSAVLRLIGGFLVIGLPGIAIWGKAHGFDSGPRSCVMEQLKSPAEYDRSDVRAESGGLPLLSSKISLERDINILYWDLEATRSCLREGDHRPTTETFFDYNLRKLLARRSPEIAARFPDVLVLDNCSPCDRLDKMHVVAAHDLKKTYGNNCEYIPRNEYRRLSGGTCLFWSAEVKMIPLSEGERVGANDRVVDWVPLRTQYEERERFRMKWIYRLAEKGFTSEGRVLGRTSVQKKVETDGLLLNRFSPRIFQTRTGFRFHLIPVRINRVIGSPLDNVFLEASVPKLVSSLETWEPRDGDPEALVHNQINRLISEYQSYVVKVKSAPRDREVPIILLGNFQVPLQLCGPGKIRNFRLGARRNLKVLKKLNKTTSLKALPSLCDWPTSSTSESELVHEDGRGLVPDHAAWSPERFNNGRYLQMQIQHSYFEVLPGPIPMNTRIRSEVLPLPGTNSYPQSLNISY